MGPITVRVRDVEVWTRPLATRIPFRFGIARLDRCIHLYVMVTVEDAAGRQSRGVAADHLVPKWFDKSPTKTYAQELREQAQVLQWATAAMLNHEPAPVFRIWLDVYREVAPTAAQKHIAPLVSGFGVSLVERAMIDAVGRLTGMNFRELVQSGVLGIDLAALDPSVASVPVKSLVPGMDSLPAGPGRLWLRQTVGLTDAIEEAAISPADRVNDGLPQSMEGCIAAWGVRYFKIKVSNNLEADLDRLRRASRLLWRHCPDGFAVTLDGNEQYQDLTDLKPLLRALSQEPELQPLARALLWIEQPLVRSVALDPKRCTELAAMAQRWPIIIDESDADLDSFSQAVELGYSGTSHKNCKGVFRTLLNAARARQKTDRMGRPLFLSAEDLTTIGPVSLEADLEVVAALGIGHVERNGHFYFRGLAHLGLEEQARVASRHAGVYEPRDGFYSLRIADGRIDVRGLASPGLGGGHWPDVSGWAPGVEVWLEEPWTAGTST